MIRNIPVPLITFPDTETDSDAEFRTLRLLTAAAIFCRFAYFDDSVLAHSKKVRQLFNSPGSTFRDLLTGSVLRLIVRTPVNERLLLDFEDQDIDQGFLRHCLTHRTWKWPVAAPPPIEVPVGGDFVLLKPGEIGDDPEIATYLRPREQIRSDFVSISKVSVQIFDDATLAEYLDDCTSASAEIPYAPAASDRFKYNPEVLRLSAAACEELLSSGRLRDFARARSPLSVLRESVCSGLYGAIFRTSQLPIQADELSRIRSLAESLVSELGLIPIACDSEAGEAADLDAGSDKTSTNCYRYGLLDLAGLLVYSTNAGNFTLDGLH